jgi:hypothetical protein
MNRIVRRGFGARSSLLAVAEFTIPMCLAEANGQTRGLAN